MLNKQFWFFQNFKRTSDAYKSRILKSRSTATTKSEKQKSRLR